MIKNAVAISPANAVPPCGLFSDSWRLDNGDNKRAEGRFYTKQNPFDCAPFKQWAARADLPKEKILEPFAGSNNLIKMLQAANLCKSFAAFDIVPGDKQVAYRDTLRSFPKNFNVCVTNPPWLAKNSATRRGLPFPSTKYDDLYKHCLSLSLLHCGYVAILLPESFIRTNLFVRRLSAFISLSANMFEETEHPVGLALFEPRPKAEPIIYRGAKKLGCLSELRRHLPPVADRNGVVFNAPDGNLGLLALDNNYKASIRFCPSDELQNYEVKESCRAITKIRVPGLPRISSYNKFISDLRQKTEDVFLTAYRGIRKDGRYRRRLDYGLARDIINLYNPVMVKKERKKL